MRQATAVTAEQRAFVANTANTQKSKFHVHGHKMKHLRSNYIPDINSSFLFAPGRWAWVCFQALITNIGKCAIKSRYFEEMNCQKHRQANISSSRHEIERLCFSVPTNRCYDRSTDIPHSQNGKVVRRTPRMCCACHLINEGRNQGHCTRSIPSTGFE